MAVGTAEERRREGGTGSEQNTHGGKRKRTNEHTSHSVWPRLRSASPVPCARWGRCAAVRSCDTDCVTCEPPRACRWSCCKFARSLPAPACPANLPPCAHTARSMRR
eukprot:1115210-Prymnesium_polylepis.1